MLHACFDNLPHTGNIYQGDFIGFGGDYIYRPNTITYKFNEIVRDKIRAQAKKDSIQEIVKKNNVTFISGVGVGGFVAESDKVREALQLRLEGLG